MCVETHNKSFDSGLTAINKVCKCIVYIIYDIIVLFYCWLYNLDWAYTREFCPWKMYTFSFLNAIFYDPKIKTVKYLVLFDQKDQNNLPVFNTASKVCKISGLASSHSILILFAHISYF